MATRSAAKAHRQSLKRRARNRAAHSAAKTFIRRALASIASSDLEAAGRDVRTAVSTLDRAVGKGILHPNNAARRKSRLLRRYNAAQAALPATTASTASEDTKPAQKRTRRAAAPSAPKRRAPKKAEE